MQKFLGVSEIPRTKAIKKIWEYIKENNLQDPANKREIVCDENLKSIFGGRERVGFLEISGLMGLHFLKEWVNAILNVARIILKSTIILAGFFLAV